SSRRVAGRNSPFRAVATRAFSRPISARTSATVSPRISRRSPLRIMFIHQLRYLARHDMICGHTRYGRGQKIAVAIEAICKKRGTAAAQMRQIVRKGGAGISPQFEDFRLREGWMKRI